MAEQMLVSEAIRRGIPLPLLHECRGIMGTENEGQDLALLSVLEHVFRRPFAVPPEIAPKQMLVVGMGWNERHLVDFMSTVDGMLVAYVATRLPFASGQDVPNGLACTSCTHWLRCADAGFARAGQLQCSFNPPRFEAATPGARP